MIKIKKMIKNIFLRDSNKNNYMNGDFKYNKNTFYFKNENVSREYLIDKIIIYVENEKKIKFREFIYRKVLTNGFNIKINSANIFDENIKCIGDFYKYDTEVTDKTDMSSSTITKITIDCSLIKFYYNHKIEITLNDDYSGLSDFNVAVKLL